ncbi:hypothetical protein ACL9SP_06005 [Priestia flexa]|uniref:hypothetical protein n=1 Tax=Priestia flexa TaxID=86664 RepID=UPI0039B3AC0A
MSDENKTRQETAASLETAPAPKKAPTKLIIGLVILFVLIGAAVTFGYVFMKSPKQLYLISEVNTYNKMTEEIETKYGESLAFQEKALEQPSSSAASISGDFSMNSLAADPSYQMIQDMISKSTINVKTEQDPKKQETYGSLTLDIGNTKALDVEGYQTKEQIGFKAPILANQFFYLNLDEYGQVMRMFDPSYTGPDKLELNQIKLEDLELTEKEKKAIATKYGKFFYDNLDEDYFTKEKNAEYKQGDETLKFTRLTLEMNQEQTEKFVQKLVAEMAKDDELQTIIAKRVATIAESSAATDPEMAELTDEKEVKKQLKEGLDEFKTDVKDLKFPKGFKSTVYINDDEVIVDRNVEFAATSADDKDNVGNVKVATKDVEYGDNKRAQQLALTIGNDNNDSKVALDVTNDITADGDKSSEKLVASIDASDSTTEDLNLKFTMDSVVNGKTDAKQTADRKFTLDLGDQAPGYTFSGDLKQDQNIDASKGKSDYKFDINLKVGMPTDSADINLKINSNSELKDAADIPAVDSKNGKNVKDITPVDLMKIQEEFYTNLQGLMMDLDIS